MNEYMNETKLLNSMIIFFVCLCQCQCQCQYQCLWLPTCVPYEVVSCECEIFGVFIREGICSHGPGLGVIMGTVPCKKRKGGRGSMGGCGGEREG